MLRLNQHARTLAAARGGGRRLLRAAPEAIISTNDDPKSPDAVGAPKVLD